MSETIFPDATIAQYTIVSKLGEGDMGEVYRARDPKLGRDVAIKVLPASLSENVDRLNRFEQEAQAAVRFVQNAAGLLIRTVSRIRRHARSSEISHWNAHRRDETRKSDGNSELARADEEVMSI